MLLGGFGLVACLLLINPFAGQLSRLLDIEFFRFIGDALC